MRIIWCVLSLRSLKLLKPKLMTLRHNNILRKNIFYMASVAITLPSSPSLAPSTLHHPSSNHHHNKNIFLNLHKIRNYMRMNLMWVNLWFMMSPLLPSWRLAWQIANNKNGIWIIFEILLIQFKRRGMGGSSINLEFIRSEI